MGNVPSGSAVSCLVASGVMLNAPVYEPHERGSNWAAVIGIDPTKPGGLSRQFVERGRGPCLYLVEQIGLFDAVEFAADYTTSTGTKRRNRWFGVVIAKTEDSIVFERFPSGITAVLHGKSKRTDRQAVLTAMREQQKSNLERMESLQREIEALEALEARDDKDQEQERPEVQPETVSSDRLG